MEVEVEVVVLEEEEEEESLFFLELTARTARPQTVSIWIFHMETVSLKFYFFHIIISYLFYFNSTLNTVLWYYSMS
jgi:hypothetical protein